MKFTKPSLVYLDEATTAIQGNPNTMKAAPNSDNGANHLSSTSPGYPAED